MKVILAGSGRNLPMINRWDTDGIVVVGVNNVWRGTDKWDHLIHSGDYPAKGEIKPRRGQKVHSVASGKNYRSSYMGQSGMGWEEARVFLGLPIYFTAAHWAIWYLKPSLVGHIGFDMDYTPARGGATAFYGVGHDIRTRGVPDPHYQVMKKYGGDPHAMQKLMKRLDERRNGAEFVNLSRNPDTVLPWKFMSIKEFQCRPTTSA